MVLVFNHQNRFKSHTGQRNVDVSPISLYGIKMKLYTSSFNLFEHTKMDNEILLIMDPINEEPE